MADTVFGGDPRVFTHCVRAISNHLYRHFYHKITGDSMRIWVDSIDQFREVIWEKMQEGLINESETNGTFNIDWEVCIPFQNF